MISPTVVSYGIDKILFGDKFRSLYTVYGIPKWHINENELNM